MAIEIFKKEKTTKVSLVESGGKIFLAVVDDTGEVADNGFIAEVSKFGLTLSERFDGLSHGIATNGNYVLVEKE